MSNQLQQLLEAGQSVWLDNLRRSMFASGELKRLIDQGLRGMTSNPTIFEKAIGTGDDYDEQLSKLIGTETIPTRSSGISRCKTSNTRAMRSASCTIRAAGTTAS